VMAAMARSPFQQSADHKAESEQEHYPSWKAMIFAAFPMLDLRRLLRAKPSALNFSVTKLRRPGKFAQRSFGSSSYGSAAWCRTLRTGEEQQVRLKGAGRDVRPVSKHDATGESLCQLR
jgi:hypothetical protein